MRLVPILALVLSVAACSKSGSFEGGDKGDKGGGKGGAPAVVAPAAGGSAAASGAEPVAKAKEPPPAPKPPSPPKKTGILDLELQEVDGGYKIITPRATQFFTSKPEVQRQDAQTPFGDTIPGAVAVVEGGDRFAGLIYIPIPKDIPYDVPKGLKGARDGMLGMFDPGYKATDEKAKLGPFDANHVMADGSREGHTFHVEAWIAFDPVGRTVYGLMSLRMPTDLGGISKLRDGFALREDAVAEAEPAKVDKPKGKASKKDAPKSRADDL